MISLKELGWTRYYLRALREPAGGAPVRQLFPALGEVKLYVCLDKNAPNRCAYMRRPLILVEDKGSNAIAGYAAVLVCESDSANAYLAAMEDPTHSSWHPDNAESWTPKEKRLAALQLRELKKWIHDTLIQLGSAGEAEVQDIAELADFLPSGEEGGAAAGGGHPTGTGQAEESGLEIPKVWGRTVVPPRKSSRPADDAAGELVRQDEKTPEVDPDDELGDEPGDETNPEGTGGGGGGGGPPNSGEGGQKQGNEDGDSGLGDETTDGTDPNQPGTGTGDTDPARRKPSPRHLGGEDVAFRSFALSNSSYRVVLHALRRCRGTLALRAIAEDGHYAVRLLSASDGTHMFAVEGNEVRELDLRKGRKINLELSIESTFKLSLGLSK